MDFYPPKVDFSEAGTEEDANCIHSCSVNPVDPVKRGPAKRGRRQEP